MVKPTSSMARLGSCSALPLIGMECSITRATRMKSKAFQLTGTYPPLSTEPVMMTTRRWVGAHSPSISANGTTDGILWVMSGGLLAFNATDLGQELYASTMVPARDTLPKVAQLCHADDRQRQGLHRHTDDPLGVRALAGCERKRRSRCGAYGGDWVKLGQVRGER